MKFKIFFAVTLLASMNTSRACEEEVRLLHKSDRFFETPPGLAIAGITKDRLAIKAGMYNGPILNEVYIYSLNGTLEHTVTSQKQLGEQLFSGGDGKFATEYGDDLALWDLTSSTDPVVTFNIDGAYNNYYIGYDVAIQPDGKTVVFTGRGSLYNTSLRFRTDNGSIIEKSDIGGQTMSRDGNLVISAPGNWPGKVVGSYAPFAPVKKVIKKFPVPIGPYFINPKPMCTPDASVFVARIHSYSDYKYISGEEFFETQSGNKLGCIPFVKEEQYNFDQEFSSDGRYLASAINQKLTIYDMQTFKAVRECSLEDGFSTNDMWFSPDNNQLYVLSYPSSENEKHIPSHLRRCAWKYKDEPEIAKILTSLNLLKTVEAPQKKGRVDIYDIDLNR